VSDPEGVAVLVRPEVAEFAVALELKLRKNDHKCSWKEQPIEAHIKLLEIELMEFKVALKFLGDEEAAKECVDIANFALIIRDKLLVRIKTKAKITPPSTDLNREAFRQALDNTGHTEATVFGHWALESYDAVYHPELAQQSRD